MSKNTEMVEMQAKQHKKLFENIRVEDKFLRLKDKEIYMVFYMRFNKSNGIALISPQSNLSTEEYQIAFENFSVLFTTMGNISTSGKSRANINYKPFYQTRSFLEKVLREIPLPNDTKDIFERLYETLRKNILLQERLKQLLDDYVELLRNRVQEGFTIEDVDYSLDILVEMDYIQYSQLNGEYHAIDDYQYIHDYIQENDEVKSLATNEVRGLIKQMAGYKNKLSREINSISHFDNIENLTKEEHMRLLKQQMFQEQQKSNYKIKKELRTPILD